MSVRIEVVLAWLTVFFRSTVLGNRFPRIALGALPSRLNASSRAAGDEKRGRSESAFHKCLTAIGVVPIVARLRWKAHSQKHERRLERPPAEETRCSSEASNSLVRRGVAAGPA